MAILDFPTAFQGWLVGMRVDSIISKKPIVFLNKSELSTRQSPKVSFSVNLLGEIFCMCLQYRIQKLIPCQVLGTLILTLGF